MMTTRTPMARPPVMANNMMPAIRPTSNKPRKKPAEKKARMTAVKNMSSRPTDDTELMSAAQAK